MKQELIAGIVLVIMGLGLALLPPEVWWTITEKWKTKDGSQPSKVYTVLMCILGTVFALTGAMLIKTAVK